MKDESKTVFLTTILTVTFSFSNACICILIVLHNIFLPISKILAVKLAQKLYMLICFYINKYFINRFKTTTIKNQQQQKTKKNMFENLFPSI